VPSRQKEAAWDSGKPYSAKPGDPLKSLSQKDSRGPLASPACRRPPMALRRPYERQCADGPGEVSPTRPAEAAKSTAMRMTCSWKRGTPGSCAGSPTVRVLVLSLPRLAQPQVGVHHLAHKGRAAQWPPQSPGRKSLGLQAPQHVHLGPGLDLVRPRPCRFLDHGVGGGIICGISARFLDARRSMQRLSGAEHAKGQDIHLHQAHHSPGRTCPTG